MQSSFLKYLEYEKRYSKHTISSYHADLTQFQSYLDSQFPDSSLEEVNYALIRSWVISLVEEKLSPSSVNRKIASLRAYYKFLLRREIIDKDPTTKIRPLKTAKKLPQFVQENDIIRLLNDFRFEESFEGYRDRIIMELLYGTGIRLSELINLPVSNIDFHQNTLKVLGKRNKERVIPFTDVTSHLLQSYLNQKNNFFSGQSAENLLVTNEGKPCYPMFVYRTVKKYLSLFTTLDKRSPHVLRHTFATHLLNKGADLNAVKDLLGHTSLAATQVYTHNSIEKLKAAFEQAHPKA
ncbi:MAG: tyrosine-type recombinase/integrase [Bacteroidota bacterium]